MLPTSNTKKIDKQTVQTEGEFKVKKQANGPMRQNIAPWREKTHPAGPYRVTLGTKKFLTPTKPPGQPRGED